MDQSAVSLICQVFDFHDVIPLCVFPNTPFQVSISFFIVSGWDQLKLALRVPFRL